MILHRGLSFPLRGVDWHVDKIRRAGLLVDAGIWRMIFPDLKPKLKQLWGQQALQRSDVHTNETTPPWVCACAWRSMVSFTLGLRLSPQTFALRSFRRDEGRDFVGQPKPLAFLMGGGKSVVEIAFK